MALREENILKIQFDSDDIRDETEEVAVEVKEADSDNESENENDNKKTRTPRLCRQLKQRLLPSPLLHSNYPCPTLVFQFYITLIYRHNLQHYK